MEYPPCGGRKTYLLLRVTSHFSRESTSQASGTDIFTRNAQPQTYTLHADLTKIFVIFGKLGTSTCSMTAIFQGGRKMQKRPDEVLYLFNNIGRYGGEDS